MECFEEGGARGVQAADGGKARRAVLEGNVAEGGGDEAGEGGGEVNWSQGETGGTRVGGEASERLGDAADEAFRAGAGDEEAEVAGHVSVRLACEVEEVDGGVNVEAGCVCSVSFWGCPFHLFVFSSVSFCSDCLEDSSSRFLVRSG